MQENNLDTPILLIIFNRPDTTRRVFEAIRKARPKRLFVSADGPRLGKPGEREKCEEARKIASQIDWPCEAKFRFEEKNLGCKRGVSSAISWFFENVECGIILEDDCLPNPSFFPFCTELLARYERDEDVMMISGDNFIREFPEEIAGSYYFSKYAHIWGWATWKRAWELYDLPMESYPEFRKEKRPEQIFGSRKIAAYWRRIFDAAYDGKIDTWDAQWQYSVLRSGGLCIVPRRNLISNIGFGADATHTHFADEHSEMETGGIGAIVHPERKEWNRKADLHEADRMIPSLGEKMIRKIRSILHEYL